METPRVEQVVESDRLDLVEGEIKRVELLLVAAPLLAPAVREVVEVNVSRGLEAVVAGPRPMQPSLMSSRMLKSGPVLPLAAPRVLQEATVPLVVVAETVKAAPGLQVSSAQRL